MKSSSRLQSLHPISLEPGCSALTKLCSQLQHMTQSNCDTSRGQQQPREWLQQAVSYRRTCWASSCSAWRHRSASLGLPSAARLVSACLSWAPSTSITFCLSSALS